VLLLRVLNVVTFSLSVFMIALKSLRRGDQVIVVTNPPTLPFFAATACKIRGAQCAVLVYDVYPEALVAAGIGTPGRLWVRLLDRLHKKLYRSVDRVIVLGRDMLRLVQAKIDGPGPPVVIIPNWADLSRIRPSSRRENPLLRQLGLLEKFVIEYSGNMGRTHDLEGLVECARILHEHDSIHFLFIGSGAKGPWLHRAVKERGMTNVTILPPQRREDLHISFTACDIAVISFVPGMAGVSVPSRMYDVLAAGKPILAVGEPDSELALLVREEHVGYVVETGNPVKIAEAVKTAWSERDSLDQFGRRARSAAEEKYSYESVIQRFRMLLEEMSGRHTTEEHEDRD
jgi:glycosyltransferase involved in cell wall biosynthesis